MNLIKDLQWRHACKGMNGAKVPQEKLDIILEAINLTPTSLGMQAFKVLIIENEQLKQRIYDEACQQQPITGCSHLLLFAPYTHISEKQLDDYFDLIKRKRNPEKEWMDKYRAKIEGFIKMNEGHVAEWLARQVYIALGIACVAAANEKVDSVPIEGFDKEILNRILDLPARNLTSGILLPIGYRDVEKDWMASAAKVRKDLTDIVEVI